MRQGVEQGLLVVVVAAQLQRLEEGLCVRVCAMRIAANIPAVRAFNEGPL